MVSEKIIQLTINKRRKGQRKKLSGSLNGAFSGQMSRLATAVAVHFTGLAAVDGHVTCLAAPVALDLGAVFLNVAIFTARVALLLFLAVTITSQMAWSATSVTTLLSLSLRLITVFGDVATFPTVVADVLEKITILSMMTRLTTAVTDVRRVGGTALGTSATASSSAPSTSSSSRASPGPVARASTLETFFIAHGDGEILG